MTVDTYEVADHVPVAKTKPARPPTNAHTLYRPARGAVHVKNILNVTQKWTEGSEDSGHKALNKTQKHTWPLTKPALQ